MFQLRKQVFGVAVAAFTLLPVASAHAATYFYDTPFDATQGDPGVGSLAKLVLSTVGSDVKFTLTADPDIGVGAYIDYLRFNYVGVANIGTLSFDTSVTGDAVGTVSIENKTDASFSFNLVTEFENSNKVPADRLTAGDTVSWTFYDVAESDFAIEGTNSLLHVNALPGLNGGSTKFQATKCTSNCDGDRNPPPDVPLPATLPLLVGGAGLLGWLGRRKSKKA